MSICPKGAGLRGWIPKITQPRGPFWAYTRHFTAFLPLAAGFVFSAVVGYLSIGLLLKLLKVAKLKYFSYYVWALAAFILLDAAVLNIFW